MSNKITYYSLAALYTYGVLSMVGTLASQII
jgi:hypothetical protein